MVWQHSEMKGEEHKGNLGKDLCLKVMKEYENNELSIQYMIVHFPTLSHGHSGPVAHPDGFVTQLLHQR